MVFATWSGSIAFGDDLATELPRDEIAKRGRESTAYLEVGPGRSATAFCIHPSGLFVTNDHVFQGPEPGQGGGIKVVVNSGTLDQKVLVAKVVRRDRGTDLTLLRAEAAKDLHALLIGSEQRLEELAEVFVFGFPFGRSQGIPPGPGGAADQFPSISVNRGAISSPIPLSEPLDLQLVFAAGTPTESRVPMARSGSTYTAKAMPFPPTKGPESVLVEVRYPDGLVRGVAEDRNLDAGNDGVRLGHSATFGYRRSGRPTRPTAGYSTPHPRPRRSCRSSSAVRGSRSIWARPWRWS